MNPKKNPLPFIICFVCLFVFQSFLDARTWNVFPKMSRDEIQSMIDLASDGDTVKFHKGIYDFSHEPIVENYSNEGLFNIVEKSLNFIGQRGNLIIGPNSENPLTINARGLHAFHIINNLDSNKDVTFDGLNIKNFLRGIVCWYIDPDYPNNIYLCGHDLSIANCSIIQIHRDCVSARGLTGSFYLKNNTLVSEFYYISGSLHRLFNTTYYH